MQRQNISSASGEATTSTFNLNLPVPLTPLIGREDEVTRACLFYATLTDAYSPSLVLVVWAKRASPSISLPTSNMTLPVKSILFLLLPFAMPSSSFLLLRRCWMCRKTRNSHYWSILLLRSQSGVCCS